MPKIFRVSISSIATTIGSPLFCSQEWAILKTALLHFQNIIPFMSSFLITIKTIQQVLGQLNQGQNDGDSDNDIKHFETEERIDHALHKKWNLVTFTEVTLTRKLQIFFEIKKLRTISDSKYFLIIEVLV